MDFRVISWICASVKETDQKPSSDIINYTFILQQSSWSSLTFYPSCAPWTRTVQLHNTQLSSPPYFKPLTLNFAVWAYHHQIDDITPIFKVWVVLSISRSTINRPLCVKSIQWLFKAVFLLRIQSPVAQWPKMKQTVGVCSVSGWTYYSMCLKTLVFALFMKPRLMTSFVPQKEKMKWDNLQWTFSNRNVE